MPEGDTIFRTARTLSRALTGHPITGFTSVWPRLLVLPVPGGVVGRTVTTVEARGKHLLIWCGNDLALRTHMRMHGSWHIYRPDERWRVRASEVRIRIDTPAWVALGVAVPDAEWLTARGVAAHPVLSALGPDLLAGVVDVTIVIERMRADATRAIADVLLDQRVLAGIGNVFKSEVLFSCRIHPLTPVGELTDAQLISVVEKAQRDLALNVADRGTETTGRRVTTGRLNRSESLWVYGRKGQPCFRCATPIARAVTGPDARSTYWCPTCQPGPSA